ncbi:cytochrome c-type biogenesis protein CcmH [Rhodothalassium salexigens DSM 2132]|uniref:Cytochrome c-type biogenesis protein CcmH n=1 Tax=Rhodothalassium salexigens DSM 2132 TaxID=1188247 RepID=A0A4R2PDK8_RHOSA|nr:c-type cytochrome biogenesis protein CcmI [Rhodothalassium salexigens]MBB4212335.1 cytochrome c-type biogenesis protein CcmH [Rhodothalassium salexigens DSM 2132]MBK1638835.1 c-type cytochrome biogenesis protein CcmI [Rhodothalassium salexigens DSM 2132]TCP32514.1 cytochrome c-type biogenesis protein CcmH [Rhodothalassium salexigens DSM 2132]
MSFAIAGLVLLALLATLWWRLGRAKAETDETRRQALMVYKSQLADLDRDVAEGRLAREDADAAAVEIKRRALAADRQRDDRRAGGQVPRAAVLALALVGVAIGAVGYALVGDPNADRVARAERSAAERARAPSPDQAEAAEEMAGLVDQLERVLKDDPDRADGWAMLARYSGRMGQWSRSADAYERAARLDPDKGDYWVGYGEALVQISEGQVTPAARLAFNRAAQVDPGHPAVAYYTGVALAQRGDAEAAIEIWQDALDRLPQEAERARVPFQVAMAQARADLQMRSWRREPPASGAGAPRADAAEPGAAQAGTPSAGAAQADAAQAGGAGGQGAPAGMPQPSQEAMAAASEMTPAEREAFIASMVDRLAARLADNPDDRDGWLRLARARRVQGDSAAAAEALRRALDLTDDAAQAAQIRQQLETLETSGPTE